MLQENFDTQTLATTDAAVTFSAESVIGTPAKKRVRHYNDLTTGERIVMAREMLTTVQNNVELATWFAGHGYDADRIAEGVALQAAAETAHLVRPQLQSSQLSATDNLSAAAQRVRRAFFDLRLVARTHFKDAPARQALSLNTLRPRNLEAVILNARATYTAALEMPEYAAALEAYQYTPERLQSLLAEAEALYTFIAQANDTRGASQRATRERVQTLAALDEWMRGFRIAARIIAREHRELAAGFGLR